MRTAGSRLPSGSSQSQYTPFSIDRKGASWNNAGQHPHKSDPVRCDIIPSACARPHHTRTVAFRKDPKCKQAGRAQGRRLHSNRLIDRELRDGPFLTLTLLVFHHGPEGGPADGERTNGENPREREIPPRVLLAPRLLSLPAE